MNMNLNRRRLIAGAAGLMSMACGPLRAQPDKPVAISDMHTHLGRRTRANSPLDLAEEMKANKVLLAAWAYATDRAYIKSLPDGTHQVAEPNPMKIALAMRDELRKSRQYVQETGIGMVLTAQDVDRALAGLPSVVLACEGTDFMQGRMGLLDEAYGGGLRHVQLVHYTRNAVGDIQTEAPQHGGLSDFGRDVIRKAQAKGMLVDLAHSTESAVSQALEIATKPMIWSHGWVDRVPGSYADKVGWQRRRLSLDKARDIAKAGGVVGIWGFGLKHPTKLWSVGIDDPKGYATAVLALIDKLGPDHVALGTDLAGVGDSGSVNSYGDMRRVIQALQDSKIDSDTLSKVSYLNYARVLKACLQPV
ncbi:MAG: dipeptidase [Roseateles sp.]